MYVSAFDWKMFNYYVNKNFFTNKLSPVGLRNQLQIKLFK